jgi:hypothetical protein
MSSDLRQAGKSDMMSREECARRLAEIHYQVEPGITQIFSINGPDSSNGRGQESIRLLEVNEHTIPSGIVPLGFGANPSHGIDFPSVVVEVTPDEFEDIRGGRLKLPHGWSIGVALPRPSEAAAS